MKKAFFSEGIRAMLILLFCYTAVSKWLAYEDFMYQLRQSPFIHGNYRLLSFLLPGTEILISGLLLFSNTAKAGLVLSAGLLILFTGYITAMLLFAPHVPCSCGGFINSLSWQQHIVLNSILAVLAVTGAWLQNRRRQRVTNI